MRSPRRWHIIIGTVRADPGNGCHPSCYLSCFSGMQADWCHAWALTPAAILQENLAQVDKHTPYFVLCSALMKPVSAIINSKVMGSNQHYLGCMPLCGGGVSNASTAESTEEEVTCSNRQLIGV